MLSCALLSGGDPGPMPAMACRQRQQVLMPSGALLSGKRSRPNASHGLQTAPAGFDAIRCFPEWCIGDTDMH
jgi:hypothetical protein